jgi:uncharacterized membrane protein
MHSLILGLVLFFTAHSIAIVAPHWRDRMALSLGSGGWRVFYSLLSLAGLLLVIQGFAEARAAAALWYQPTDWMRTLARVFMVPVFPLLLAAYLPGRLQAMAKHPMLAAVKFWASAHLLANGNAADVLLFGSFLAWAVVDRISLKRRKPRPVPGAPPSRWNDAIAVAGGLLLYFWFLHGVHLRLFGVSPLA